jgi:RNA polymerase sigma-70 factor, ECF subfamily
MSGMPPSASVLTGSTSSSLIVRAIARDADAWRRLSALYAPLVYRWARRANLQSHDAADVVQEVFRGVATHLADFRRDRPGDSFRGWLWTITRNKVRDHYRRRAARQEDDGAAAQARLQEAAEATDDDTSAPATDANMELAHRVLSLVQGDFEPRTWQAFWRTAINGASPRDVGDELSMTIGAVYMAKSRVLARIRQELTGLMESERERDEE